MGRAIMSLQTTSYEPATAVFGNATKVADPWWRGATIYQIYPRSFKDTNGDGIGDLNGIIEGLPYISELGVDAIWISPFFKSPMHDFGYDVADYRDIDPMFGELSDFDRLIENAHALGLRIIIDQVYSHTSDEHAWFKQSRACKDNAYADWYVWADPKPDGSPPNNWQSVFGGSSWTWDSRRTQYYFHNFLSSQPDLNVHNPAVQNALLDVAKFWLERGVDGFRLDAINFAMHDPALTDNPPAPKDGRIITRPFDLQEHLYNQSHPDIPKFLSQIRGLTDQYNAIFTVAEIGGSTPMKEMKAFTADNTKLNSAYGFDFLYADELTPDLLRNAVTSWRDDANEGFPSWAFSNHDAPRAVSRWAAQHHVEHAAEFYMLLLLSLRGNVFIFQGDELGLPQADVPYELLKDPEAILNWPRTLGRDGARTPMPWNDADTHAGFSSGTPWLPVDKKHIAKSVSKQQATPHSTLSFTKRAIAVRNASPALRCGAIKFIDTTDGLSVFERETEDQKVVCAFNLSDTHKIIAGLDFQSLRSPMISVNLDDFSSIPKTGLPPFAGFLAE